MILHSCKYSLKIHLYTFAIRDGTYQAIINYDEDTFSLLFFNLSVPMRNFIIAIHRENVFIALDLQYF